VSPRDDPVLREFRGQISETDRTILDAVNTRLELVARIKAHKDTHGIAFLDPDRERSMLEDLTRANRGPLSADGLHELFGVILDLTKREVGSGRETA
jgi:3-deoxy-7-phosphoheptulonate synthase/chorismate mutase